MASLEAESSDLRFAVADLLLHSLDRSGHLRH